MTKRKPSRTGTIRTGYRDGIEQPYDLSMGMTYDSPVKQWLYDQASIFGQRVGRLRDAWHREEGQ